ncbi:MAG: hypothetical protein HY831_04250 [Candidatus Aenigmarchaeota archaeon]|nr:hypothetical protein [Candidatus Aenigmarchaeota archaeon]
MDSERFEVLVNVLKIIEKQRTPTNMQSLMEIVENYDEDLTQEQRAMCLKEILNFARNTDKISQSFRDAEDNDRMRNISRPDYFF